MSCVVRRLASASAARRHESLRLPQRFTRRTLVYKGREGGTWQVLPSGSRWMELHASGNSVDHVEPVESGQVVRVEYMVRLNDGTRVGGARTASFRIGNASSAVCAALEEVAPGMRLGDTRRLRAPPQSRRGTRVDMHSPAGEMLEYDVTLTGYVANRQIVTLDSSGGGSDDPLQRLFEFGRMHLLRIFASLSAGLGLGGAGKTGGPR